ncbi:MAG: subclass B3 metallo-beta-lactamase [Acidobacteria bacterium]|jgi:metallo-beta-lactamase class B|nr:subclass B3 metallo-beta-lactamase [Acidobacteriota bacterium]HJN45375.1 subclass B3 metallo-beta-lactamase [Vicinamibacterales bacterium]|tara:strand:+ start:1383 stop:2219 length:837 start_codon:yes stop_codon:yes gene_type:complete
MMKSLSLVGLMLFVSAAPLAQRDWNAPFPAHRVIDNIYFVGTEALGTFLVTTSAGHILINSDFEATVPLIRQGVEELGFAFDDIRIVLGSHAHGDHMQADALVKELTGAQVMVMREDVEQLRAMQPDGKEHPIDRILEDGDRVTLGDTALVAHHTPGHTKGCTSWGLEVAENGVAYDALIVCSFGVNANYILVDNPDYPQIADDYRATFAKARALPVDVFLGAHGSWYDLETKYERLQTRDPEEPNPFVDRAGYLAHIDMQEQRFEAMLERQQAAKRE